MATTNLNLDTVVNSQTVADFVSAFNGNMQKLDALPIPKEAVNNSASATSLSSIKFADGTLLMWGTLSHGTTYRCTIDWEGNGGAGYASEPFTVNFPVACTSTPTIIPWCTDSNRCETFIISSNSAGAGNSNAVTDTTATFRYWSAVSDNGGSKSTHILVIGRWK